MMRPFTFIGIFCEDIRNESQGTQTLVGILPDNVKIGGFPGMLSRISVYIRIQLDRGQPLPNKLCARMKTPGKTIFEIAEFTQQMMVTAKEQADKQETPFTGLIATGTFVPMPVTEPGRIEAIVEVDGTEYVCGVLNLIQPPETTSASTASQPPA
jgi:hypothetical protein